jgi:glycogen debranching enzyme
MISAPPSGERPEPLLLTGLASAALLDGRGDLELEREMRGTPVDWGGVFGQCVRLTRAWRIGFRFDDRDLSLPTTRVAARSIPGGWESQHTAPGLAWTQQVVAVSELPGVVRAFRFTSQGPELRELIVSSSFRPVLSPVLVEGIQPHRFDVTTSTEAVRIRQRTFGLSMRATMPPAALYLNRATWRGGSFEGRVEEFASEHRLALPAGGGAELAILIHGGIARDLDGCDPAARSVLADPGSAATAVDRDDRTWLDRTPRLSFPDAPMLERGYDRARAALRRLYSAPGDDLTGLVAGYPWYSALWCRDIAWMLDAVAWLGDLEWMRRSIDTVLRFQCRSAIPILGGEPGELPMQISPGPIFLYGTSDTTLYYPLLMERWLRHSGADAIPEHWPLAVERILGWGERRSDPGTGLLRNGGEAEEISTATGGIARVRYGIDAPDTTIWDSADRREHAIDVQVLWWSSLNAARSLVHGPADPHEPDRWEAWAGRLAASIRSRYPWAEERYLYDSLRGGRGVAQVRPNALRAVSAGLFRGAEARQIVARAVAEDLTTLWGVRTLSSRDPTYDPVAYHEGQVWTIATAWLADAALEAGMADLGVAMLDRIAGVLATEGMGANECFRGDRPEPFDSCFLLGFSVAPFVTTLFERLWGLTVDARAGRLEVRPRFPTRWRSARLERLRVGRGTVDLDWTPTRLRVGWSGPGTLLVDAGAAPAEVGPGPPVEVRLAPAGEVS